MNSQLEDLILNLLMNFIPNILKLITEEGITTAASRQNLLLYRKSRQAQVSQLAPGIVRMTSINRLHSHLDQHGLMGVVLKKYLTIISRLITWGMSCWTICYRIHQLMTNQYLDQRQNLSQSQSQRKLQNLSGSNDKPREGGDDHNQKIYTPPQTQRVEEVEGNRKMTENINTPQEGTALVAGPTEEGEELRLEPWPLDGSTSTEVTRRKSSRI